MFLSRCLFLTLALATTASAEVVTMTSPTSVVGDSDGSSSTPWSADGSTPLVLNFDTSAIIPAGSVLNSATVRVAGTSIGASYRAEVDLQVSSPSGQQQSWDFGSQLGFPNSAGSYDSGNLAATALTGNASGTFSFSITEDYNDSGDDNQVSSLTLVIDYTGPDSTEMAPIAAYLDGVFPSTDPISGGAQPPATLSATGAFSDLSSLTAKEGLLPYEVNSPLWSDGAQKLRWIAVPSDGTHDSQGEQIDFDPSEPWTFPVGTVAMKHFELPADARSPSVMRRLETRFIVAIGGGDFYGITYRWREDGSEADLLPDGGSDVITLIDADGLSYTQTWDYPSRLDCRSCHNLGAGVFLGINTWQLNRETVPTGESSLVNQLTAWAESGLFSEEIAAPSTYPRAVAVDDATASLESRVHSYLAANCSSCHSPTGDLNADFDLRYSTPLLESGLINGSVLYELGIVGGVAIAPGEPDLSLVHRRLNTTDVHKMPPIGRNVIDTTAVTTLNQWIMTLSSSTEGHSNPPTANDDDALTREATVVVIDTFANDYDVDGDTFSFLQATTPAHGTVTWSASDGMATYTPVSGYLGTDSFTYQITDSTGATSQPATVSIVITASATADSVAFTDSSSLLSDSSSYSGVAMGVVDMNQDGRDDIVRLMSAQNLFIDYQNANGSFSSLSLGKLSSLNQWGLAIGDTDNNGFPDLITGGYLDGLHYLQASNSGNGFTSTTLDSPVLFLQAVNFVDIDGDGWLDLFPCDDIGLNPPFRNQGDGTLVHDASLIDTSTTPTSDNSGNYGSVWTDYDNDGDLDLYISKCRAGVSSPTDPRRINQLFRKNSDGSFTEVAQAAGMADGTQSWTSDFADIDNDGDLDAFIGNHGGASLLMQNQGDGTFVELPTSVGIDVSWNVIQSIFRDFNNDGWVDLLLTGAQHGLWLNDRDGTFTQVANPFTSNDIESCAVGDLNKDGFVDIYAGYATLYNTPHSSRPDKLFLNNPNGNGFLSVTLKGRESNRLASGARLELYGPWGVQVREVRSGEGYGITNSYTQTFGLGNEATATKLIVRWPSGTVDTVHGLAANQFLSLEEGDSVAPTLATVANRTTNSETAVSLQLVASDPHDNALTFGATGLPTGLSLNGSTGLITGTTSAAGGAFEVTVSVSDGWSTTAQSFIWTIDTETIDPGLAYGSVRPLLPTRIEAEDFDLGANGVSYYDNNSGNVGDYYRDTDVDLEPSLDLDNTPSLGWAEDGEWLNYSIELAPGTWDIAARAASEYEAPGSLRILLDDELLGSIDIRSTGDWYAWHDFTLPSVTITGDGPATLRLEIVGASFNLNWLEFREPGSGNSDGSTGDNGTTQTPYDNTIATIPGKIQAELFDDGPSGVTHLDVDTENIGGSFRDTSVDLERSYDWDESYSIGWIENSEWTEYSVDVTPGIYDFTARIASEATAPGLIRVLLDDRELGLITIFDTEGWYLWANATLTGVEVTESGPAILRLEYIGGPYNLNWIEVTESESPGNSGTNEQAPFFASAAVVPGRIQAENYDLGGEGVAYVDNEPLNLTGSYRSDGVDIEPSYDIDQSFSLGWFDADEWVEYTISADPGTYSVTVRTAAGESNPGDLRLSLDDIDLGTFDIPDTGGPHTWASTTLTDIVIPEGGTKTLRVETVGNGINFNWVEFTRTSNLPGEEEGFREELAPNSLLARAFGSWDGVTGHQEAPQVSLFHNTGESPYCAITFLIRLGGWQTGTGYATNELNYEPQCSTNMSTWLEHLRKIDNPSNLPVPPAGFKYVTYRLPEGVFPNAFFRVAVDEK